ncbi:MAG: alpha-glucuronidase family glycosyl hydrolase [Bacteroidota bacterium]
MKKILLFLLFINFSSFADDGYRLWLKYDLIKEEARRVKYASFFKNLQSEFADSPTILAAKKELNMAVRGLFGEKSVREVVSNTGLLFHRDTNLHGDAFSIDKKGTRLRINANTDIGILYGLFELLRRVQSGENIDNLNFTTSPKIQIRMLNHWDNVLGTIERGYAGASLWKWYELPETIDPRYIDYARANASIGINAVSVNNVNASARFLTKEYLVKVKALADVFRPYGIKVYLSLNFASPKILDRLKTSDPLDPAIADWWKLKVKEVYSYIPDLGGFLVKANSEGEPGPQEYGRNHADGANMLAKAAKPFKGNVIWRAFVYGPDPNGDRFKEAYNEFKPLDGQFDDNVIVQVKNGPIDFQSREPFHPLFGAMAKTPVALEFQITQEYLGFSTNIFNQANLFKETLESDTYAAGKGSTVAKIIDGSIHNYRQTAIAGVANTGSDRNWTGHFMSQANWYAYGRLAWDHTLTEDKILDEWTKMTFINSPEESQISIKELLLGSRSTYIKFTTPFGLHHIMGQGIHFGPEPWLEKSARPDWTSIYYHRADSIGLGFNRSSTGNNTIALYKPEVQAIWGNADAHDENFLMWFHHIPWTKKMQSGQIFWDELCFRYYRGVDEVAEMQTRWNNLNGKIDSEIFADVKGRLARQHAEALNWRDACVLYFQTYSKLPIPAPLPPPTRTLDEMKNIVRIYQLK